MIAGIESETAGRDGGLERLALRRLRGVCEGPLEANMSAESELKHCPNI